MPLKNSRGPAKAKGGLEEGNEADVVEPRGERSREGRACRVLLEAADDNVPSAVPVVSGEDAAKTVPEAPPATATGATATSPAPALSDMTTFALFLFRRRRAGAGAIAASAPTAGPTLAAAAGLAFGSARRAAAAARASASEERRSLAAS